MIKTYKFKLYNNRRNRRLDKQINIAGMIFNHCLALHKRYYRIYNKFLSGYALKKHITKLKKLDKYKYWNKVGSQCIQDIVERIDKSYQMFFKNLKAKVKTSPHKFKKIKRYKSITFKQHGKGYKVDSNSNKIIINKKKYRFFKSRDFDVENIKTMTLKRKASGYSIYFSVKEDDPSINVFQARSGKSVGMDFGLKTFLTLSDGNKIKSPEFFKKEISKFKKFSKKVSSKRKGSKRRAKAVKRLALQHETLTNKRKDFFFKLGKSLSEQYDYIFIEDLNMKSIQKLWGRKVSDLSFHSFVQILEYQSSKYGSIVHKVGRFYPSSKLCSNCGEKKKDLTLRDRTFSCPHCGFSMDRDLNASKNILREGASSLRLGTVNPSLAKVGAV